MSCWTKAVYIDVYILGSRLDKWNHKYQSAVLFAWVKIISATCPLVLLFFERASDHGKVDINALLSVSNSRSTLKYKN